MPKISVILPVKDAECYIHDCISSILNQSFIDFELLVMDDGSIDSSISIIKSFKDERIKFFSGNGFIPNLNRAINLSKAPYLARMDADDIMHVDRLKRQYEIMNSNTDIAVCASYVSYISDVYDTSSLNGSTNRINGMIDDAVTFMLLGNIVSHPTVMIRKNFLELNGLSYENYPHAEDYKLWFEVAKKDGKFYVIPEELLQYRLSSGQVSSVYHSEMAFTATNIKKEIIQHLIEERPNILDCDLQMLYQSLNHISDSQLLSFDAITSLYFKIYHKKGIKVDTVSP